jgi:hypothetical protein
MRKLFKASLAALMIAGATSAQAGSGISLDNLVGAEYDTAGVFLSGDLTYTGTVDNGGGLDFLDLLIYDDSALRFSQSFSLAIGATDTFHFEAFYAGLVGTAAPGIGIVVEDEFQWAILLDPFHLPHYADPSQCQENCGPTGVVPEPSTWAMMLLGFGAVGYGMRRRRRRENALQPVA